jgi:small-conductance mechanosensitive channel
LKLVEAETTIDIVSGENIIMSISENDAIWNNSTKYDLAESTRKIIGTAVMNYKSQTSLSTILKKVALALLALLVLFFIIRYTVKLFRWTAHKITEQEEKQIKGIKIKNYTLFDAKMQIKLFLTINRIVEWVSILLIIYISLPILFGIFPWTKNFANILFGFILNPVKSIALSIWDYLPNLITIIVIIIVFRYVLKGLKFLKLEVEKGELSLPGFYPEWANPTYQLIRVLVYAFMIIVIFPYLPGSESPIFRGVSVFLGFLFTFGSAGSLSNIMSGLILTYMRLFKKGDRVKIGDVVGDIIEKSLLVTRVRTIKNEIISIPNSTIMNSHTINYSSDAAEKGLIIHTTVTIGYDVPWREMHQALIDAAIKTDLILDTPKPFVLQTSLDDFYVSYQINGYVRESNKQAVIYSNLHQNIQDICNERGIEILSPHYRAARDGNMTTIPASYLPDDYQKPSFDIKLEKENDK